MSESVDNTRQRKRPEEDDVNNEESIPRDEVLIKEEYFKALQNWLNQTKMLQSISSCFPYYLMANYPSMFNASGGNFSPNLTATTNPQSDGQFLNNNYRLPNNIQQPPRNTIRITIAAGAAGQPRPQPQENTPESEIIRLHGGLEYRIPPIWKRVVSEFIDFLILFFLKLAITFIAVDFFEVVDLDKFDFEHIKKNIQEDYKLALEMTTEIVYLEIFHRVIVCFFEAFWLQGGMGDRIGGATPGKAIMGLRVVIATAIIPVPGRAQETVLVYPGTDLGLSLSTGRAIVKNLLLAFLFPVCFVFYFFQYNRTCYDMLFHAVVVEEDNNPPRRRHA